MKKLLGFIVVLFSLFLSVSCEPNIAPERVEVNIGYDTRYFNIVPIEFQGHQYIFISKPNNASAFSVVHDPDCSTCLKRQLNNSTRSEGSLFDYVH